MHKEGYANDLFNVEIRVWGLVGWSADGIAKNLTLTSGERTRLLKAWSSAAEKASSWLWFKREDAEWSSGKHLSNHKASQT